MAPKSKKTAPAKLRKCQASNADQQPVKRSRHGHNNTLQENRPGSQLRGGRAQIAAQVGANTPTPVDNNTSAEAVTTASTRCHQAAATNKTEDVSHPLDENNLDPNQLNADEEPNEDNQHAEEDKNQDEEENDHGKEDNNHNKEDNNHNNHDEQHNQHDNNKANEKEQDANPNPNVNMVSATHQCATHAQPTTNTTTPAQATTNTNMCAHATTNTTHQHDVPANATNTTNTNTNPNAIDTNAATRQRAMPTGNESQEASMQNEGSIQLWLVHLREEFLHKAHHVQLVGCFGARPWAMPLTLVMPSGSSIVSHSVSALSGSCTGSRISAGRSPSTLPAVEQGSSSGHWFIGKEISPVLRKRLIEELNINANYTNPSATGLQFAWGRFLECTAALAQAKEMVEAGSWPADIPLFTEWMKGKKAVKFAAKSAAKSAKGGKEKEKKQGSGSGSGIGKQEEVAAEEVHNKKRSHKKKKVAASG
ncbi:hypothetical protein K443DRAFT_10768 [Laccaria amethystina LaAM-08-1]|uniref:Uncharacterized protein n=1 Tax=Laccaria amethystina LaAM-08-1 TaxID=1095629 RepID=A0A0C9X4K0_9AGAR|nr:hypothetical protein K443DRAFT_10768 [Laccaria amethystina LaAM-08-1]